MVYYNQDKCISNLHLFWNKSYHLDRNCDIVGVEVTSGCWISGGRVSSPEVGHCSCPASVLLRFSLCCSPTGASIDIWNCRGIQIWSNYILPCKNKWTEKKKQRLVQLPLNWNEIQEHPHSGYSWIQDKKNSLYAYMALSYIGELGNPIQSLGSRKYSDNNQAKCLSVHLFQITIRQ